MALHGSRKDAEQRRLQAMTLLEQGCCQSEVARQVGVTPGAVSQWVKAYRRDGPDALKAKVHSGPKPKLNPPQIERLQKLLLQGATHHGFATELWTLARIVAVVRKHFGVTYDPSGTLSFSLDTNIAGQPVYLTVSLSKPTSDTFKNHQPFVDLVNTVATSPSVDLEPYQVWDRLPNIDIIRRPHR
jgi:transposase